MKKHRTSTRCPYKCPICNCCFIASRFSWPCFSVVRHVFGYWHSLQSPLNFIDRSYYGCNTYIQDNNLHVHNNVVIAVVLDTWYVPGKNLHLIRNSPRTNRHDNDLLDSGILLTTSKLFIIYTKRDRRWPSYIQTTLVHYSGITLYQTHMTHDTYTYDKNSQLNTSLLAGDMQFECCWHYHRRLIPTGIPGNYITYMLLIVMMHM